MSRARPLQAPLWGGPHPEAEAAVGEPDSAVRPWPRLALGLLARLSARLRFRLPISAWISWIWLSLGYGLDLAWISGGFRLRLHLAWFWFGSIWIRLVFGWIRLDLGWIWLDFGSSRAPIALTAL